MPNILYRDFYDVPRMILLEIGSSWVSLDSPVVAALDDYEDRYQVYVMPEGQEIGAVRVSELVFDATRRRLIGVNPVEAHLDHQPGSRP